MMTEPLSVAVVDDDPIQVEILRGIAEAAGLDQQLSFSAFRSLGQLLSRAGRSTFDIVFLDRRLPDCDDFSGALATLSQARLESPLILMSAHAGRDNVRSYGLRIYGPVDKMELVQPTYFKRLIADVIEPAERAYG